MFAEMLAQRMVNVAKADTPKAVGAGGSAPPSASSSPTAATFTVFEWKAAYDKCHLSATDVSGIVMTARAALITLCMLCLVQTLARLGLRGGVLISAVPFECGSPINGGTRGPYFLGGDEGPTGHEIPHWQWSAAVGGISARSSGSCWDSGGAWCVFFTGGLGPPPQTKRLALACAAWAKRCQQTHGVRPAAPQGAVDK